MTPASALVLGALTAWMLPAAAGAHAAGDEGSRGYDELVRSAEVALSHRDTASALALFERAASMQHRAESELGLVRTFMQDGQYRRAAAFVAHTAVAHRESPDGALLHAWLLFAGGQTAAAKALVHAQAGASPTDSRVRAMAVQLDSGAPRAAGELLRLPARMAPYGPIRGLSSSAHIVGTGTLLQDGVHIVVPLTTLTSGGGLWARNGLGQASRVTVERRLGDAGVAILLASDPLATHPGFRLADQDAFPGSAAYLTAHVTARDAQPAWPIMRPGFVGRPLDAVGGRELAAEALDGLKGGPVFDTSGRLVGIAMPAPRGGKPHLVAQSRIRAVLAPPALTTFEARPGSSDEIYESAMLHTVQIISNGKI